MSLSAEDARKVGGSDVAALVGLSPWATPLSVYARIVSGDMGGDSPTLRRGRLLEDAVRRMYAEDNGVALLGPASLKHPKYANVRASLDDVGRRPGKGRHAVEIKTVWRNEAGRWGEAGTDEIPDYYACQAAFYLGVGLEVGALDEDTADVAAYLMGVEESPRVYRVRHEPDVYAWLMDAVQRFWRDHVEPKRPPPVTAPVVDAEAARRLYPREREELASFASLGPEERAAILLYAEARKQHEASKGALEAAEARLKLALGWRLGVDGLPADTGLLKVTWKAQKQGAVSWAQAFKALAQESGVPPKVVESVANKHRGEAPRVLRVTETKEEEA